MRCLEIYDEVGWFFVTGEEEMHIKKKSKHTD